jgi:hypothetical protein
MKYSPHLLALAAGAALTALAGQAHAVDVAGTIALTDPVYNRPLSGTPPSGLSGVGTAVHYDLIELAVSASGSYVFQNTAVGAWDNFSVLYQTAFNPALGLLNALVANDDNPSIGLSGFTINLTAGTSYKYIATAFSNTGVGDYSVSITGPGTITIGAVPEPGTYAMMAMGIAGLLLAARRRSA